MIQKIKGMKKSEVTKTFNSGYVDAIMMGPFVVEFCPDASDSLFRVGTEEKGKLAFEGVVLPVDSKYLSSRGGAANEVH